MYLQFIWTRTWDSDTYWTHFPHLVLTLCQIWRLTLALLCFSCPSCICRSQTRPWVLPGPCLGASFPSLSYHWDSLVGLSLVPVVQTSTFHGVFNSHIVLFLYSWFLLKKFFLKFTILSSFLIALIFLKSYSYLKTFALLLFCMLNFFCYYYFCFFGTGVWTQDLVLARQTLWSMPSALVVSFDDNKPCLTCWLK
jgi:hypothetical protein